MIARVFGPAFWVRRCLQVLAAVVIGLAFPGAAMAVGYQIKTTPIHKGSQGFGLSLLLTQGIPYGGPNANSVAAIFVRHSRHATENDDYAFSGSSKHPLKFNGSKDLHYANINGTFAKDLGSIHLTFHATGKASRANVPNGCTGHGGESRPGTLSGSYTLRANKLGTIAQKSFKATISTAYYICTKAPHGFHVQTIGFKPAWIDVFKGSSGSVVEEFDVSSHNTNQGWAFDHEYTVSELPSSDYKLSKSHLNWATVTGGGGITGTATYSSSYRSSQSTFGHMSGTLAAAFASIGTVNAFPISRPARQSHS